MSFLPNRQLFWISVLVALLFTGLLVACDLASSAPPPTPVAPTHIPPTPRPPTPTALPRGGNLTVRLAEDVPSLRPWQPRSRGEEQITSLLYSGLMRLDPQLRPQPDLAQDWDTTP